MRTIKLTLAYDGTSYSGWQYQPGRITLQEALERAIYKITGETIRVVASGRTDAGVHAVGQVASFSSATHLPAETLQKALNACLPRDMVILAAIEAPLGFDARRDAVRKRYRYTVHNAPQPDVFLRRYAWHVRTQLDTDAMQDAATRLLGKHDFSSFETHGSQRATSVRTIFELIVKRSACGEQRGALVLVEIEADGFLYNMVRTIVGTLVEVGRGTHPSAWISEVLAAADRRAAGQTAPALGLALIRVEYQEVAT